jgi:hypothetical protein
VVFFSKNSKLISFIQNQPALSSLGWHLGPSPSSKLMDLNLDRPSNNGRDTPDDNRVFRTFIKGIPESCKNYLNDRKVKEEQNYIKFNGKDLVIC